MWVWNKLSSMKWMDAWEERFYGNENVVMNELKGGKSMRIEVYCETEKEAEEIQKEFGGSVRELKMKNWAAQKGPVRPPISIRDRLVITQEKEAKKLAAFRKKHPKREVISIPPEMAFGTGDHPTTATCLRYLVDEARSREPGWSFLDLGAGSGVLSVAAKKLGAGQTLAIDYDAKAVKVTGYNARRNRVEGIEAVEADVTKWKNRKRYDLIAANLFSDVLLATIPRMKSWLRKEGVIFLSGILAEQWPTVRNCAEQEGFEVVRFLKKGKWVTARLEC